MDLEEAISHLEELIDNHDFECLECKRNHEDLLGFLRELKQRRAKTDYCPHCGAKMDGGDDRA